MRQRTIQQHTCHLISKHRRAVAPNVPLFICLLQIDLHQCILRQRSHDRGILLIHGAAQRNHLVRQRIAHIARVRCRNRRRRCRIGGRISRRCRFRNFWGRCSRFCRHRRIAIGCGVIIALRLREYRQEPGHDISLLTVIHHPSPALARVVGFLLNHPHICVLIKGSQLATVGRRTISPIYRPIVSISPPLNQRTRGNRRFHCIRLVIENNLGLICDTLCIYLYGNCIRLQRRITSRNLAAVRRNRINISGIQRASFRRRYNVHTVLIHISDCNGRLRNLLLLIIERHRIRRSISVAVHRNRLCAFSIQHIPGFQSFRSCINSRGTFAQLLRLSRRNRMTVFPCQILNCYRHRNRIRRGLRRLCALIDKCHNRRIRHTIGNLNRYLTWTAFCKLQIRYRIAFRNNACRFRQRNRLAVDQFIIFVLIIDRYIRALHRLRIREGYDIGRCHAVFYLHIYFAAACQRQAGNSTAFRYNILTLADALRLRVKNRSVFILINDRHICILLRLYVDKRHGIL